MLDFHPDLPRRAQRGLERPAPKYPPIWRGSTAGDRITGPDALGRYRITYTMENRYCRVGQFGPTRVCVMGDFGFLVQVGLEGDIR